MLKLVILDFDGVIVESTCIKTAAFARLFSDYPGKVQEIVEYHQKNAGMSRYEKFSHIYEKILKLPLNKEKITELDKRFSALVVDEIKVCPLVSGALKFLKKYSKKLKLFIASSTPEEELRYLVKARNLQKYFKGIYGAPYKKSEIITRIIEKENVGKKETLFVGDSITDYVEAKKAGVLFIGRLSNLTNHCFPDGVKTIKDLNELEIIVEELICQ